jgi:hypothetical protein
MQSQNKLIDLTEGPIIQRQYYLVIDSVNINKKKCGQSCRHKSYCHKNHQLNVNCKCHNSNTNLQNLLEHANNTNQPAFEVAA